MESLLCSFLCFGLYSYDLWTMGNLARGPVKDDDLSMSRVKQW